MGRNADPGERKYGLSVWAIGIHPCYREDNIPQLDDITKFLKKCSGFRLRPVAGEWWVGLLVGGAPVDGAAGEWWVGLHRWVGLLGSGGWGCWWVGL